MPCPNGIMPLAYALTSIKPFKLLLLLINMKKTTFLNRLIAGTILLTNTLLFTGCDTETEQPKGTYESGVFVVNEGNFNKGNGAISFLNTSSKIAEPDIFRAVNGRPLGDNVQSMYINNEKAYVVVNNSNKIEIADANTFTSLATIENLTLPRYMTVANNKGYVTETVSYVVANGQVSVIDLNTNTIIKVIPVGAQPEQLIVANNKVFVTNLGTNTISVINSNTDAVEATISVGDSPNSLSLDANNKLWVLCGGNTIYTSYPAFDEIASTAGSLIRINPNNNTVEATFTFPTKGAFLEDLTTNKEKNKLLYSYAGKVYQVDITATILPTTALINRRFYGLGVEPGTNIIYGADAGSFTANGKAIRYNANGTAIDSFTTAVGPNGFVFK